EGVAVTAPPSGDGERMKETYARGYPLVSGETVTPGDFRCRECGYEHLVEERRVENLPVCPRCQNETWEPR
ncbi:MAG TPA: hypothetical protein VGR10_06035, partial [Thermoleophilaceae bacterium]|nr:hypothetical protein [Thermoleophilaceae bacterium]